MMGALVALEVRSILRSWPAWVLLGFMLLIEALPTSRAAVWDGEMLTFWMKGALGLLPFWCALLGVMLMQRDGRLGTLEVLLPTGLSGWQHLFSKWLAVMLMLWIPVVLLCLVVWWRDPPESWLYFRPWQFYTSVLGAGLTTAMGLLAGSLTRSPVALVGAVVAYMLISLPFLPYTLLPSLDLHCSRILGCNPLPYGWHAVYLLALVAGVLLLAQRSLKGVPFHVPAGQGKVLLVTGLLAVGVLAGTVPVLAQAAFRVPAREWDRPVNWFNADPEHPHQLHTAKYLKNLHCTEAGPEVCVPRGFEEAAGKIRSSLQALQSWTGGPTVKEVITYPSVNFEMLEQGITVKGQTVYLSEQVFEKMFPAWVTTEVVEQGRNTRKRSLVRQGEGLYQELLVHVVLGRSPYHIWRNEGGGLSLAPASQTPTWEVLQALYQARLALGDQASDEGIWEHNALMDLYRPALQALLQHPEPRKVLGLLEGVQNRKIPYPECQDKKCFEARLEALL